MDSCILQRGNVRLGAFSADQKILYFAAGDKNHGSECAHRNHAFLFNSVIFFPFLSKTAKYFEAKYKKLKIRYCLGRPKYKNEEVLKKIAEFRPDILLVAYGMKSQEMWIGENSEKLGKSGVKLAMGVGRSFDYYSGDLKRAPVGWRRMGLEWLYSLIREPKRLRRQLEIPKFLWRVVCYDVLD